MPLNVLRSLNGLGAASGVAEAILGLLPETGVMVVDADLHIVVMRGAVYERHGYDAAAAIGRDIRDVIPAVAWTRLGQHWNGAVAGESRTLDTASADGQSSYWLHFAPVRSETAIVGAIMIAQDITERVRAGEQTGQRLAQQSAVSALGSLALEGRPIDELFGEAVRVLHAELVADLAVIVEGEDGGAVSVRASAGEDAPTPPVPSPALRHSLALVHDLGETLLSHDLRSEAHFRAPVLEAAGMLSVVVAPIGVGAASFGTLLACSRRPAAFSADDLAFVESIANVLMAAVEHDRNVVLAAQASSRMSRFWQLSHDLLAVFSSDGRFLDVGGAWERSLGWAPAELIGRSWAELFAPEDQPPGFLHTGPGVLDETDAAVVVNRVTARDGSSRWLLWSVHRGPDGSHYSVAKDITDRYTEQALTIRRAEQLDDAQRLAQIGSWETDFASGTRTLSENLREMLVLDTCVATDGELLERIHPDDLARMRATMAGDHEGDKATDFRVQLPGDRVRTFSAILRSVRDEAGAVVGLRGTVNDVTEARRSEADLMRSEERFRQGFDNAPIAMTLVDPATGGYVRINDAFCSMVARTRDELELLTLAEIGHPDDAPSIAENLARLLSGELDHYLAERRYIRPDGSEIWASVSITPVREPDGGVDVLFGQMVDITERKEREASLYAQIDEIAGLGEIKRAFAEDRFELHAQPIIDLATGKTVQRELLIRMRDIEGKLIPPAAFLPAAEKYGAIRDIDRWVIAQAADLAARGVDVEINISAASIGDPGLVADIEAELARTGADPARLVFEITETALIEKTEVAVRLAERLRHLGCRFALDDFGSGYGGFHYLKHLPMDFLKIDREFIRDARTSVADHHVIRAIVGLAHGFALQTIAEGVEDQETLDLLRELGVDHAQGFHLGRPAPLAD